jgi:branched-chain amino acid transport system permease protein
MVILGGAANNGGVALGAFSFTLLFKVVDQVKFNFSSFIPFDVNWLEYMAFAALLILILAFRPGGILPEKSSLTLPWRTVAEIIESERVSPSERVSATGASTPSESMSLKKANETDRPG